MKVNINICDICKCETRDDEYKGEYLKSYGNIDLNFKNHYYIQSVWNVFTCYSCAKKLENTIEQVIEELKGK